MSFESPKPLKKEPSPEQLEKADLLIGRLEEPVREMLQPLLEKIEAGEYGVLLGEDASGRIPALIVRDVMKSIYEKHGNSFKTRFIAGTPRESTMTPETLSEKTKGNEKYVENLKNEVGDKRILLITDFINTGEAVRAITNALHDAGISFDIGTLRLSELTIEKSEMEKNLQGTIYNADYPPFEGGSGTSIYGEYFLGGVVKDELSDPGSVHAVPIRNFIENHSRFEKDKMFDARTHVRTDDQDVAQTLTNHARKEVHAVSERILTSFGY
jgi:adenine/guanine phosphoribosyltransferase-like PRPP-binding protein